MSHIPYRVYGMSQSYFTRKIAGYLDYKRIPWRLCRFSGNNPEVLAAGWPEGIPALKNPDGEFMWDSTPVIHHLELLFPEPTILPPDPAQRFLYWNKFGHPKKSTIDKLKLAEIKTYRTDKNGAIMIRTDGEKMMITTRR